MKLKIAAIVLVAVILSQFAGQAPDTQAQTLDTFTRTATHNYEAKVGGETVKIGSATNSFTPVIRFNKWNLESWLELNLVGGGSTARFTTSSVSNGVVTAENSWFRLIYNTVGVKPPYNDIGGVDFSVVLKQAPPINSITFTYNHQAAVGYLQPPLTSEWTVGQDLGGGRTVGSVTATDVLDNFGNFVAHRPDYVVHSIAFYHDTRTPMYASQAEANKYRTGQIGYLYRMKVTDAGGRQTWADWGFGGGQSQITLTIDAAWLAAASYPVTIAPVGDTFGWTSQGGSSLDFENNIRLGRYAIGADGTGDSISAYIYISTAAKNVKCNVYDDGTGEADTTVNLIANGATEQKSVPVQNALTTFNFSSAPSFTSGTYYRLAAWSAAGDGSATVFYASSAGDNMYVDAETYGTWPDPSTETRNANYHLSIYCTYTPSAGGWTTIAEVDGVGEAAIDDVGGVAKAAVGKVMGVTP